MQGSIRKETESLLAGVSGGWPGTGLGSQSLTLRNSSLAHHMLHPDPGFSQRTAPPRKAWEPAGAGLQQREPDGDCVSTRGQAKNHKREERAGKRVSFFPSPRLSSGWAPAPMASGEGGWLGPALIRAHGSQAGPPPWLPQDHWSSLSPAPALCTRSQNARTSSSILTHDPPWSIPALAPDWASRQHQTEEWTGEWEGIREGEMGGLDSLQPDQLPRVGSLTRDTGLAPKGKHQNHREEASKSSACLTAGTKALGKQKGDGGASIHDVLWTEDCPLRLSLHCGARHHQKLKETGSQLKSFVSRQELWGQERVSQQ